MCADSSNNKNNKIKIDKSLKNFICQVLCIRCHVSVVTYQVTGVSCQVSLVTRHLLHVTNANSHNHGPLPPIHSRMLMLIGT